MLDDSILTHSHYYVNTNESIPFTKNLLSLNDIKEYGLGFSDKEKENNKEKDCKSKDFSVSQFPKDNFSNFSNFSNFLNLRNCCKCNNELNDYIDLDKMSDYNDIDNDNENYFILSEREKYKNKDKYRNKDRDKDKDKDKEKERNIKDMILCPKCEFALEDENLFYDY
jgi:hypothetical protein